MARNDFVDSLFGGIARGLQIGTGIRSNRRRMEQQDRSLDLTERGVETSEGTLDLNLQKLQQARDFQESIKKLINGGGAGNIPSIPALTNFDNQPQIQVPAPQAPVPAPVPVPVPAPTQDDNLFLGEPDRGISPGILQQLNDSELRDQAASKKLRDRAASQSTAPTPAPAVPQVTPLPAPEGIIEEDVGPLPFRTSGSTFEIRQRSVNDLKTKLESILASPDTAKTVSFIVQGGGSVSVPVGKKPDANQLFTILNRRVRKGFPEITNAELAQHLQDSPLRDSDAGKAFFNRTFNADTTKGMRAATQAFRQQNKRLPNRTERNQLLRSVVNNQVDAYGGFVSKRHETLFQESTVTGFNVSETVQQQLLKLGVESPEQLREMLAQDKAGTEALLNNAITNATNLSTNATFKVAEDGTLNGIMQVRDKKGEISFDTFEIKPGTSFRKTLTTRQSPKSKLLDKNVVTSGVQVRTARDIKSLINDIAAQIRNIPDNQLDASLGIAGGFNKFSNTLLDQLKGFASSSFAPGAQGVNQIIAAFQASDAFQNTVGGKGQQAQNFLTQYTTLLLKSASLIGLGEGRAISDKDLDLVKNTISNSGATNFKQSLSALNNEANRVDDFNISIIENPEKSISRQAPNPDPFTGAITTPGRPFTVPDFLGGGSQPSPAPAPAPATPQATDPEAAKARALQLLDEEGF